MKTATRIVIAIIALAILILAGVRIVSSIKKKSANAALGEPVLVVRAHKVAKGQVVDQVRVSGNIRPKNEVDIFPKIAGRLTLLNVDVGDRVQAGEVLGIIEHTEIALQEKAALGSLATALANEAAAHVDLMRMKKLLDQTAISPTQFEQVQLKFDMAKAQAKVAKAQADLAGQQLANARITSPISGVVTKRSTTVGNNVSPQASIFTVQDASTLKLVTSVDANTLGRLKKGMQAAIKFDQLPKITFSVVLTLLSSSLDSQSRRATVELEIQDHLSRLVPNMFVNGQLIIQRFKNVVVIPNMAIDVSSDAAKAFRIVDNKIQVVALTLGQKDEVNTVVLDGLSEGDDVAISGFQSLSDGKSVTIEDPAR